MPGSPPRKSCFGLALATVAAVVVAVWVGALAAPSAAAADTVSAGRIEARIGTRPWTLRFVQPGGPTLTQSSRTGLGPSGRLGFRTALGWHHATHALSRRREGGTLRYVLATNDPRGGRLVARVRRDGEGVVTLASKAAGDRRGIRAVGIGFDAPRRERYLGFGERSNAVDQRGRTVENYVADGPWQPEERQFMRAFVPPWGFGERDDSTYFPMPWLLSTSGYGVLLRGSQRSWYRLGSDRAGTWSVEANGRGLRMSVFAGPEPAGVLRRLTRDIGRQPSPAAPWMLGAWFHTGQENQPPPAEERGYVRMLRRGDAPVSVVETHLRYLPCGAAVGKREYERRRTRWLHRRGLATISYLNPEICQDYEPVFSRAVRRTS